MHWKIKGLVQKALSIAPGGSWLNDRLQRTVGELKNFDAFVDRRVVGDWAPLVEFLGRHGIRVQDLDCVEVGTGWCPILPVCFSLAGAHSCRTIDRVVHLNADLTLRMLRRVEAHLPAIARVAGLPLDGVRASYAGLREADGLEELLRRARIEYIAPGEASRTGLPDGGVDMVFSNNVLEHVEPADLPLLMKEARRILKPGGICVHCVACNDHYAHFDRGISFVNYLQYPASRWRFWNNGLNYQNRVRACEFVKSAANAGLTIVSQQGSEYPGVRAALSKLDVAPEFQKYSLDELATTSITFLAQVPVS
jgi:SAM-dependent methyltransferase